jgi:hypothetical protein
MSNNTVKFNANVNIKQDLNIQGNLNVKGTTNTVNQETLTVKDNLVVTNAYGAATPYTGIVAVTGNKVQGIPEGGVAGSYLDPDFFNKGRNIGEYPSFVIDCKFYNHGGYYNQIILENPNYTKDDTTKLYFNNSETGEKVLVATGLGYADGFNIDTVVIFQDSKFVIISEPWEIAFFEEIFMDPILEEREEAYASPLYNTEDNEVQLGLGYIGRTETNKVEFNFGKNENQALATRSSSLADGDLAY